MRAVGCAFETMKAPAGMVRTRVIGSSARRTSMPCVARLRASSSAREASCPGTITYSRIGLLALGDGAAAILEIVAHELLAVARGGDRSHDRGVEMVHHAVAIGQRVAVAAREGETARRRLLVGVADRSLESRPRVAVSRIERVVDLADVIRPAALVEARGVGAAEQLPAAIWLFVTCGLIASAGGEEVIRVVAALLVEVDGDLRQELETDLDAAAGFRLRLREPVAVHVEQIVIAAPARPRLVVLGRVGSGVCGGGAALQVLEHEARAAVGVLHRIDQHQRVA